MKSIYSGLLSLALCSLSFAQTTESITETAVSDETRVQQIMAELDGTEWTGKAGFFIKKEGKNHLLQNDAYMAFGQLDGKLYYLSSINKKIDALIEKGAQGLCVKSPPRRVEFTPLPDGKSFSAAVYVPSISKKTGEKKFARIILETLRLENNQLLINDFEFVKGRIKLFPTQYSLDKMSSPKTAELAAKLKDCLAKQPWLNQ